MAVIRTLCLVTILGLTAMPVHSEKQQGWRETFNPDKSALSDTGRSRYFILEPGYRLRFAHKKDTLTITVLNETRIVDGVKTRVVEESETSNGEIIEVSRNYFAIDRTTGDTYYFGEEVDIYKNGKVTSHEGAWLSGENGARFGLALPGNPGIGDRYYQELAPKVAMDRAEVVSLTEKLRLPAGAFTDCVRTKETSAIEMGSGNKWYAPGIGLVRDDDFVLVGVDKP